MVKRDGRALVHLNALRAFEAALRRGGFVGAAEELNVTPSAVSQQVRTLEDYLGVELFVRSKSGITPTPAARAAYPDVRDGLSRLARGLRTMRGGRDEGIVTITVPASFASKWLLPRMDRFRAALPDVDLRIDTTNRLADYAAEGIDIGVRYGFGNYAGFICERLVGETVFPVCSPSLLPGGVERLAAADVRTLPLIHDQTIDFDPSFPDWRAWFAANGIDDVDLQRGLHFNSSVLAVQAAIDGQGVALGRSLVVDDDLRAGRLVRPCDAELPVRCAYYVLYLPDGRDDPGVRAVRDWLFAEIHATPAATAHKKI